MERNIFIQKTKNWIDKSVLGLNTCPFAHTVIQNDSMELLVSKAEDEEKLLQDLLQSLLYLLNQSILEVNTLILIHPFVLREFEDYLDFLENAVAVLEKTELDKYFQLASFHPLYQFQGTTLFDKQNYTNRSPYPMIHILRENVVAEAIDNYPNTEEIPLKNIETFEALSWEEIRNLYKS